MENDTKTQASNAADAPGITGTAVGTGSKNKKRISVKLIAKLVVVSILIFSAAQLYLYDTNKNGSENGIGNVIKSINPFAKDSVKAISDEEVKNIVNSLVPSGTNITINSVTKENGLFKLSLNVNSQDFTGFLTLDGKQFFPQVIDVADAQKQVKDAENKNAPANSTVTKNDKPNVELFVMSHCPYGTQIEKGILPVVDLLKDKIDFSIKFVNYAMHGDKEIAEELNQYCIQKNQTAKYEDYLKCFLKDGNGAGCLTSTGINASQLSSCVAETDKTFNIIATAKDKSKWSNGNFPPFDVFKSENEKYGVQGSPTLVINGAQAQSGRDSKSLLATVCSAFNNQPSECSQSLSAEQPAPGFGTGTASGGSAPASCGS